MPIRAWRDDEEEEDWGGEERGQKGVRDSHEVLKAWEKAWRICLDGARKNGEFRNGEERDEIRKWNGEARGDEDILYVSKRGHESI